MVGTQRVPGECVEVAWRVHRGCAEHCGGCVEGCSQDMLPIKNLLGCVEGAWRVCRGCMEGVQKVHGGCAEGAWRVCRGCAEGCGGDM